MSDQLAIVGAACRLPGGIASLEALWSALATGRDLITEVPPDRFDADHFTDRDGGRAGRSYTCAGGFLDDIAGFDADFFGISPREASRVDPQQRLMLEMAVDALDYAGIGLHTLAGSDTGVFVGASYEDYGDLQQSDPDSMDAYSMSGWVLSNIANRLSHVLDLRGPSMAIGTACSSSLVAVHQACQCLRAGECRIAIAGGVNVLLNPYNFVGHARASLLSPTGRCHTFSAVADGYVRSEGGGAVVLKRLPDALADGDRIHAVILGTGTNSDGRTVGLKQPSSRAQESLLRQVCTQAGVDPDELVYFEAHGTGTPVGDPIECEAIGRALGRHRPRRRPLPIGSVKTSLGHLEPAAGVAGLLTAMLVLRTGRIPASLHATPLNPAIDFAGLNLAPVTHAVSVEANEPAVVGVNSFGFGGANAHVLLGAPPGDPPKPAAPAGILPVVISARSHAALRETAQRLAERLDRAAPPEFYDICWTACRRRSRHPHRAAALGANAEEVAERLLAVAAGEPMPGSASGTAVRHGRIAFVFSGNGSQWPAMGADLLAAEPAFRAAVEAVDARLSIRTGWSVVEELSTHAEPGRMCRTEVAQPALFAVQVGLVELLRINGISPTVVLGHSVGEVAAAYTAGALDLDAATTVIAARSAAQARSAGQGRMAAVGLGPDAVAPVIARYAGRLELAAVNTDEDVTVAGDADAVHALGDELNARGEFCRELDLDYAFHSATMDPFEKELRDALRDLRSRRVTSLLVSTVTGAPVRGDELGADYWWHNVRQPVLFAPAVKRLLARGVDVLVEVGPQPVLCSYLRRLAAADHQAVVIPTLARAKRGPDAIRTTVASAMAAGADIEWAPHFPRPGTVAPLPGYPWQRERHWHGEPRLWVRGQAGEFDHPLLGERIAVLEPTWRGRLEPGVVRWLRDHRVGGVPVVPGTAFVEMALAAGRRALGAPVEIDDLACTQALVLPIRDEADPHLQVSLSDEDGVVRIATRTDGSADWRVHARGRVRRLLRGAPSPVDISAVRSRIGDVLDGVTHYERAARCGLDYGPAFQVLRELRVGTDEVLAGYVHRAPQDGYEVHPALLDGVLQSALPLITAGTEAVLLDAIGAVRVWRQPTATGFAHATVRSAGDRQPIFDVVVTDETGAVTVELSGCRMRRFDAIPADPVLRYSYVLRAAPREDDAAGPSPLPSPREVLTQAGPRLARPWSGWRPEDHARFVTRLKQLAALFIARAFGQLVGEGNEFGAEHLMAVGVHRKYRRMIDALLDLAHEYGLIERTADGWRVTGPADPEPLFRSMLDEAPEHLPELLLLGRCGRNLAEVLRGRRDPLELIFHRDMATAEHFYDGSVAARRHNLLACGVLGAIAERWPADHPLRVLEVGAGTGGTTATLLPALPADRIRYAFTDVSEAFLTRAAARFAGHDFVDYRRLDLERDPTEQGFAEAGFDLVVAANVLHATSDLRATLQRVARLLAPGGQLLLIELGDPEFVLLIFGLLDGWWSFSDTELRSRSPLLTARQWPDLLLQCGFGSVARVDGGADGGDGRDADVLMQFLAARDRGIAASTAGPVVTTGDDMSWIVVAEDSEAHKLASAVQAALSDAGAGPVRAVVASDDPEWTGHVDTGADAIGVVLILGARPATGGAHAVSELTVGRVALLRAIAAACQRFPAGARPALWLVTTPAGALPAPEQPAAVADAALWGATRCLAEEQPRLAVRRISLHRSGNPADDAARLARELLAPSDEDEIVLTGAGRFVPRLVPLATPIRCAGTAAADRYALALRDRGRSYRLAWTPDRPAAPGPHDLEIAVRAVGLNYLDVLWSLGLLPEEAMESGTGPRLGLDCAGVVTAVGSAVTTVRPGDPVVAVAPGAFASHAVTHAGLVRPMPDGMSFTAAATIPIAFLTVHHGLQQLARLAPGEVLLVHGGAGGVGLAAVQHARRVGARVIATAGSEDKRDLLRLVGVGDVLGSRSPAFADEVMEITGGRGVDVVLNSLMGEAIPRSLELLRPGGRFVELGKRDLYADSPLRMRCLRDNISLFALDVAQLARRAPERLGEELGEVTDRIRAGDYRSLPHRVYPAARVTEAFHLMQHSRHVGKVVVSFDEPVPVEHRPEPPRLDPKATYLVTGGLGGVGAASARWLADHGARHLALVGRRGGAAPEAAATITALTEQGAVATAYAADVTDRAAMREVIEAVDATGHPLRGVIHAAMALDDGPLTDLTAERLRTPIEPKVGGGLVLHELTTGRALDLFVLFSSIAGVLGNANQAGYAAGNLILEALARARSRAGQPALAVAFGPISDTGHVARNGWTQALATRGLAAITAEEAMTALGDLLGRGVDMAVVARIDRDALRAAFVRADAPRLAHLVPAQPDGCGPDCTGLLATVANATLEHARALVEDAMAGLVASVLSTTPDLIDRDRSLDQLGLDSLMSAELRTAVKRRFGHDIPVMQVIGSSGIAELAQILLGQLRSALGQHVAAEPPSRV